jgi:hypothetical protein
MAVRSRLLAAAATVGVLSVSACSGTATSVASPDPTAQTTGGATSQAASSPPTSTTRSEPYLTVTPTLTVVDGATKPGTKLKFGDQAVIPYFSHYATGLLGVTITVESVKASDEEINKLKLKDEDKNDLRGKNFFFVHMHMVNVEGADLVGIQSPILTATTKSGGWPGRLFGIGEISVNGCEDTVFAPTDFRTKGASYDTCDLHFGQASDPITKLQYDNQPYTKDKGKSVIWQG